MNGVQPFDIAALESFNVNVDGQPEVQQQPLYDYQVYPNAGFTGQLLFFQVPIGQLLGAAIRTLEDTNMRSPGRMPQYVNAAITGVQVWFRPGTAPSPAEGAAVVAANLNDVNAVHGSRMSLTVRIGDKPYLEEAPLGVMPPQFYIDGPNAVAGTYAAGDQQVISYAAFRGPQYQIVPLRLVSNQEFSVFISSPAAVALPSGIDGRIGVRLIAQRYRLAQ